METEEQELEYKTPEYHHQDLYNYQAGCACGVLITKSVMKKLAKLQAEHLSKVKKVLLDGADEQTVFDYSWTLAYPNGKQTEVTFIDSRMNLKQSIENAVSANRPIKKDLVFISSSMKEAEAMANEHYGIGK